MDYFTFSIVEICINLSKSHIVLGKLTEAGFWEAWFDVKAILSYELIVKLI